MGGASEKVSVAETQGARGSTFDSRGGRGLAMWRCVHPVKDFSLLPDSNGKPRSLKVKEGARGR